MSGRRHFASDNFAAVLPEVMRALEASNAAPSAAHAPAYGGDDETQVRLAHLIRRNFGSAAVAFPVFGGTGANVVALLAACPRSASAVVCIESAHIACDEGGAPESAAGLKLHALRPPPGSSDGKLTPALVEAALFDRDSVHRAQAGCVSISQTTELGCVYSVAEVRALAEHAHARGMLLHMDGARISNAAAALGCPLRAFTTDAGVDVLSFGGTKVGAMGAEAVVVLNPSLLPALPYLRKSFMQLASKQRFISAQLCALLEAGTEGGPPCSEAEEEAFASGRAPAPTPLCVRVAARANLMAARLLAGLHGMEGVVLPPVGALLANAVFPVLPRRVTEALHGQGWRFYVWNEASGQVRLMTAWDHGEKDVEDFLSALREALRLE